MELMSTVPLFSDKIISAVLLIALKVTIYAYGVHFFSIT